MTAHRMILEKAIFRILLVSPNKVVRFSGEVSSDEVAAKLNCKNDSQGFLV